MTDLDRLGKPGSYRLGRLRTQGSGPSLPPPSPRRPRFRRRHRGPTSLWLLAAVAGAAAIAGGAAAGLWFAPLVIGLVAGLVNRVAGWRARVLVPAVAAMAVAGLGIPLCWPALHGQPAGGTTRVIAGLPGLPGSATGGALVTLLVAVAQALAGLWLGRALTPRPRPVVPGPDPQSADPADSAALDPAGTDPDSAADSAALDPAGTDPDSAADSAALDPAGTDPDSACLAAAPAALDPAVGGDGPP